MDTTGLSRSIRFLVQDQEARVLAAMNKCQEVQAQLSEHRTALAGWCEQQRRLENDLQRVIDESRSARMLMQEEESRASVRKEDTKERERQLHVSLKALCRVTPSEEALLTIDEVDHRTNEAVQRAEETQRMFPDVAAATAAKRVSITLPERRCMRRRSS